MSGGFAHLDILILAVLAGFFLYRLANSLGRRTGHERPRANPYAEANSKTADSQRPADGLRDAVPAAAREKAYAPQGSPLARALTEISIADRKFDPGTFLAGARLAYEMIINAFAAGNLDTLKSLLSPQVYGDFAKAIAEREKRGETLDQRFIGLRSAEITDAALHGRVAEVTVRFLCELVSCTKNSEGAVIEGDPVNAHEVRDLWTFARDTRSSDPNWKLVATHPA